MSKVYVVNHSGYDYSKAQPFGEVVVMTQGYIDYKKLNVVIQKICSHIDTSTQDDYILLSGNNFLCAIALQRWAAKHGICKILHWHPSNRNYELYNLNMET